MGRGTHRGFITYEELSKSLGKRNLSDENLSQAFIHILNENISFKQWIGVTLGFTGAIMVIGYDAGSVLPLDGLIAAIIALIAITTSTIWQKKVSNDNN